MAFQQDTSKGRFFPRPFFARPEGSRLELACSVLCKTTIKWEQTTDWQTYLTVMEPAYVFWHGNGVTMVISPLSAKAFSFKHWAIKPSQMMSPQFWLDFSWSLLHSVPHTILVPRLCRLAIFSVPCDLGMRLPPHLHMPRAQFQATLLAMPSCCMFFFFAFCLQAAFAAVSATPSQPQLARFYIHTMRTIAKRLVLRMYDPHHVLHVHAQ